jgi:uncharacterized protein YbcI
MEFGMPALKIGSFAIHEWGHEYTNRGSARIRVFVLDSWMVNLPFSSAVAPDPAVCCRRHGHLP